MAAEQGLITVNCVAENDLSSKQYYIVELSGMVGGVPQVDVCDAATDIPFGVLLNEPAAGESAEVAIFGLVHVISDGSTTAISRGDRVGTDSSGKAVKKATVGDYVLGEALEASSTSTAKILVKLSPGAQRAS